MTGVLKELRMCKRKGEKIDGGEIRVSEKTPRRKLESEGCLAVEALGKRVK